MANIKSAKKRAKQDLEKNLINNSRKTAIKTSSKSIVDAIAEGKDVETLKEMLKDVEAKIARAKNKHVLHKNTASRKIGRLAKRVAAYAKTGTKVQ